MSGTVEKHIDIISDVKSIAMADEWYDIADENHFWIGWRLAAMLKQLKRLKIPLDKKIKVLDVGGGMGILRAGIEANTVWDVDVADLNLNALNMALKGRGKTYLYDVFDEDENLIGAYDVVILYDILEHIDDTGPFLRSVLKHLKPDGFLFLNVPALQPLYSIYDSAMGHFRRYNCKTLRREFDGLDLEIIDLRYWGVSMLPLLVIRSLILFLGKRDKKQVINRGFKPPSPLANSLLKAVGYCETAMFNKPVLGTSILMVGTKR